MLPHDLPLEGRSKNRERRVATACARVIFRVGDANAQREKIRHHRSRRSNLRRDRTDMEGLLWWKLREYNRRGYHFRRQVPVCGYFLDFADHLSHVAIELDGSQHGFDRNRAYDAVRDRACSKRRAILSCDFWNDEVWCNLDGVVESIIRAADSRSPTRIRFALRPPHKGEVDSLPSCPTIQFIIVPMQANFITPHDFDTSAKNVQPARLRAMSSAGHRDCRAWAQRT